MRTIRPELSLRRGSINFIRQILITLRNFNETHFVIGDETNTWMDTRTQLFLSAFICARCARDGRDERILSYLTEPCKAMDGGAEITRQ